MKEITKNVSLSIIALCIAFVFIAIPAHAKTARTDIFSSEPVAISGSVNATKLFGIEGSTGDIGLQGLVDGSGTLDIKLYGTDGSNVYPIGVNADDHIVLSSFVGQDGTNPGGPDGDGKFFIPALGLDVPPGDRIRATLSETGGTGTVTVTLRAYVKGE